MLLFRVQKLKEQLKEESTLKTFYGVVTEVWTDDFHELNLSMVRRRSVDSDLCLRGETGSVTLTRRLAAQLSKPEPAVVQSDR